MCLALEGHVDLTERDLRRAEVIQRSLLPREWPRIEGYRFLGAYLPGHNVGGDLYDIVKKDSKFFVAFIADAAGHGVSAALLAVLFRKRLEMADLSGKPLAPNKGFLGDINKALMADISAPGVFVSSGPLFDRHFYWRVSYFSRWTSANSAFKGKGEIKSIEASGPAIGLYSDATFGESQIQLERGDRLLMYTDGLFPGPISRAQDLDRLKTASLVSKRAKVIGSNREDDSGEQWVDDPDDMTVLIVEAANGISSIDPKDLMVGAATRSGQIEAGPPQIAYTENERATFLFLQGRMSWIHCQAFFDTATGKVDSGRKTRNRSIRMYLFG
ncbi:MAG: hypothetical protein CM1200mP24_01720 [Gammaproteobacteria bacterium]|nr:MAG: hypothetical protein CM1200mP24_01720 [Gammaproteobacteria bacterium]